jgi:division protein CdvB (Snf7/Vps24/ESCRT-III family)
MRPISLSILDLKLKTAAKRAYYIWYIRGYSLHVNNVIIYFKHTSLREEFKMSEKFAKKWGEGLDDTPISTKIKEAVRPPGPLKPRLDFAVKRMELQIQRLDKASDRFSERDKSIFAKIVNAYTKHDMARANVFANELAEIRKMEKMIIHARLALEQIVLRLSTVSELGDVVSTLAPAISVLRSVKSGMSAVFPEAERELGSIGNLLGGIMMDAGYNSGMNIDFNTASEDAQKIMTEAASVAEQKVKEKFPDLPSGMPSFGQAVQSET